MVYDLLPYDIKIQAKNWKRKEKTRESFLQVVTSKAKCIVKVKGKTQGQRPQTEAKGPERIKEWLSRQEQRQGSPAADSGYGAR